MNDFKRFLKRLDCLDFAFQPIVDIETRETFGVEALLRNVEQLGYHSIHHFFDAMYQQHILYAVDLYLREKAIKKFITLPHHKRLKLFYNLDNRLLEMIDYRTGNTKKLIESYGLEQRNICFEISERHELKNELIHIQSTLKHYQDEGFCLAIDDFGVGFSGFKLLYDFIPQVIKIDRFFLQDICHDLRKHAIVKNIVQLAKDLGARVIAEGIERESELEVCKAIGCEFVQGYVIQRPTCISDEICKDYQLRIDKVA